LNDTQLDGVSVFVTHGCRELSAMGHTLHLLTSIPGPDVVEGAEVSRCFGVRPKVYPEHSLSFPEPWRLLQVFHAFKPHVVHIFDASIGMASITSIFCFLFDVPCVLSHHTRIDLYAPFFISILPPWLAHIVMWIFRRMLTGYSPANLAVCMPLADQLVEQFNCRPHRVHMWHSGTDVKSFRPQLRDSAVRRQLHGLPSVGESATAKAKAQAKAEALPDAASPAETKPDGGSGAAPSTPGSVLKSTDGMAAASSPSSPSVRPLPGRGSIVGEAALRLDATDPDGDGSGGDGLPIVLYVGRLAPEKNTYILPEVAKGLATANGGKPLARLVIVGKGPSMERLKSELAGTGAVMLGARYGDELKRIYASADIFLTTCTTEAFCLVGLEAMASGLPVIAPAAGGVLELFDDGNQGYFYKPESAADAVLKVKTALIKDHAAAPMCGMRLRARELVEAQSWTTTYEQAAQHYMDVIQAL
jgi:glycosyltransferase involved in cell wall biosynthesis